MSDQDDQNIPTKSILKNPPDTSKGQTQEKFSLNQADEVIKNAFIGKADQVVENLGDFQTKFKHITADVVNDVLDAKSEKVKNIGKKAKLRAASASTNFLKHFLGVDIADQVDPSEYRIEPDEINELFRVSQQNNGGICVQLTLSITCLLYILIDTIQIQNISGTLKAVMFFVEDRYLDGELAQLQAAKNARQAESDALLAEVLAAAEQERKKEQAIGFVDSDVETEEQRKRKEFELRMELFYNTSGFQIQADDIKTDYEALESKKTGSVLNFLREPRDFYYWFRYVLKNQYENELIVCDSDARDAFDVNKLNIQDDDFFFSNSKIMMQATYYMGARLKIYNAELKDISGSSPFKNIRDTVRVHTPSYANIDEIESGHFDASHFDEYADKNNSLDNDGSFVMYFPSDMTQEETQDAFCFIKDNKLIDDNLLVMEYEMMMYSNDAKMGNLFNFQLHQSNTGLLQTRLDVEIFQPHNNGNWNEVSVIRIIIETSFFIAILLGLFFTVVRVQSKFRLLCNYKLNEFLLADFVGIFTNINGLYILVLGGQLLYGADFDYQENFHLPVKSYDEYLIWVENCHLLQRFRMALGIFVVVQMYNLLLVASTFLPSLGILFRTIEKSMADIFVFTTITSLLFAVFVVIVHISFGEHNYTFSSIARAELACFQMFLGEFPYAEMYKSDPKVSALILILFVIIMNFMILNMYTAIVIRTYNKLQARQLFLGESMAKIVAKHASKKTKNWINFLCCRSTLKKNKKDSDDQLGINIPIHFDDQDENQSEQGFCKKLQMNFQKAMEDKVLTKEKFQKEIQHAAMQLAQDKHKAKQERLQQLHGQRPEQAYPVLKSGFVLLIHLWVCTIFYLLYSESAIHADIRDPIRNYIIESKFGQVSKLNEIQATYSEPIRRLGLFDFSGIGKNYIVSENLRLTYRLYATKENEDPQTKDKFPELKSSEMALFSVSEKGSSLEISITRAILSALKSDEAEQTSAYQFGQQDATKYEYNAGYDGSFATANDEGGYVVNFDSKQLNMINEDGTSGPSLNDFLQETDKEQFKQQLAIFTVDWAMYNANYDYLIYNGLMFQYQPNGELRTNLKTWSFRMNPTNSQYISFFFFMLFYVYYTVRFVLELYATFKKNKKEKNPKNENHSKYGGARANDDETNFGMKFLRFIGIDEQRLVGQNFIVVIVLCTWMIITNIFRTTLNTIQAILTYAFADIFHMFELLNTIFASGVVILVTIVFFQLNDINKISLYGIGSEDEQSPTLQDLNKIGYYNDKISFYMAMSIYCLCFRLLRLPQFSLVANMPFAVLTQGRQDISNILIILAIFTLANALSAFVVYCPQIIEFSSLASSIFQIFKIYLGQFDTVSEMYKVAPLYTTFYLLLMMSLYTIFLTQMFLGIIVGHFETEWKLVKELSSNNQQDYKILTVIWRIISKYFKLRKQALEQVEQENKEENGDDDDEEGQSNCRKRCKLPCKDWRSLRPSGMFERIVLYFMMLPRCQKCCKRSDDHKSDKGSKQRRYEDSDDDTPLRARQQDQFFQAKLSKKGSQITTRMSDLPFDNDRGEWGNPTELKLSGKFKVNSGLKSYMNWFDGWSMQQYQDDFEQFDFKLVQIRAKIGIKLQTYVDSKITSEKLSQLKTKLPQNFQGIINLDKYWNEDVDEYEKANSNYWMYHLEKQVNMLTKKELSLYSLKNMDCFFKQNLLDKASSTWNFQADFSKEQQEFFQLDFDEQKEYFKNKDKTSEQKYKMWKAIDLVNRYQQQKRAFDRAGDEKARQQQNNKDQNRKFKHSNLMTLLMAQIERPIEQETEEKLLEHYVVTQIASPKNGQNPLKFQAIKSTQWRHKKYHRVHTMLQIVWRDCLTSREKYDFWFKHFNTLERVRLWNQLVFTREWFRRVVIYSRRQKSYLDAKAEQEKNKRNAEANKEKDEKNQEGENSEDNNASDEDDIDNSKIDSNKITYKGFHRRDVNEMLREYATTMYHNGVRTEELLLIQVRPDQKLEDIVTRENEGGTTSFFNKDTSQKQKDLKKRTDKFLHLTDLQELQQAREVFTPDEMLKMWNQFFVGSYFVEKDDKNKKDKSEIDVKEDGMDAEYRIIKLLDDEDYRNLEEKITTPKFQMWNNIQEQFDQRKTMDRYDQIHQFFQSMIQHNLKTLKSCESISKGQNDDIQEQDADEVIDSDDQANGGGSSVNKSESEISMDDNEPLLGPMRKQKKTKFELYKDVLSLVINEEERLPLWMLMTKEEKLDMLAHQCIDSEAQILSFLIEFEYGAENNFMAEGKNLQLDLLLEQSLNQMVFQKYLAYTRLQAAFYARKFTVDLIKTTRDESIKLYNYAEYLHDLNDRLKSKEKLNVTKIKNSKKNNGRDEQAFRRKAKDMIKNFKSLSDDDKESAALAMKLHFELDEANNEEKKKNQ